jgi:hypothetical protein
MHRKPYRPIHFFALRLRDGTVLGGYPIRKPSGRKIKEYKIRIDEENICEEHQISESDLREEYIDEVRFRYHDVIANNLNVLRALRQHLLPRIESLQTQLDAMKAQLDRIEQKQVAISD